MRVSSPTLPRPGTGRRRRRQRAIRPSSRSPPRQPAARLHPHATAGRAMPAATRTEPPGRPAHAPLLRSAVPPPDPSWPGPSPGRRAETRTVAVAGRARPHRDPPAPKTTSSARHMARAPDERMQVDVGQHVMLDQPAVGLVVGLFHQRRQLFVQAELQLAPAVQAAAGRAPGIDDDARQHMGAQHVLRLEFLAPLQAPTCARAGR